MWNVSKSPFLFWHQWDCMDRFLVKISVIWTFSSGNKHLKFPVKILWQLKSHISVSISYNFIHFVVNTYLAVQNMPRLWQALIAQTGPAWSALPRSTKLLSEPSSFRATVSGMNKLIKWLKTIKYDMDFYGFPCQMDFSHHESPNPARVACDEGGIRRQVVRNPSRMENHTKCISYKLRYFNSRSWKPCEMD